MTRTLVNRIRRFARREEGGVASVEFPIIVSFVLFLFFWAIDLGILMTKQVILEHSLDVAMRDLRLGRMADPSSDKLKDAICDRAKLIKDCHETIMLELQPINTNTWAMPAIPVTCRDRDEEVVPVVSYNPGTQNQIMLVRACVIVSPLFPGTGIGAMLTLDSRGGYGMAAMSAFVNEPSS